MSNLRLYAQGQDVLGRGVELYTTPRKANSIILIDGDKFFESKRFESVIQVFNGMTIREENDD